MSSCRLSRITTVAALLAAPLAFSPAFGAGEPMLEFMVVRQDTLIGLARSVMTSPNAWREVSRINRLKNPNLILPGQVLRIPARLMRTTPVPARLTTVTGDVQVGGQPAQAGMTLAEGAAVQTGSAGSAVIELADRSRVQVPPSSLAELAASRRYGARPGSVADGRAAASTTALTTALTAVSTAAPPADESAGWFAGSLRLLRGSVEVFATKVLRVKPLEVVTPTAVIGVRGTHYRVSYDEAAQRSTHSEVVEGKVRFERVDRSAGTDLVAGFGAQTGDGAAVPSPSRLLDPPALDGVPQRFERPLVRLAIPPANGPTRVQVASDTEFNRTVNDQRVEPGAEVRIAGLEDGQWHLRVRRIGERGIEGLDATRPFVLKARPEPPAYNAPRSDSKQPAGNVIFAWAQNLEAPNARLQIAQDPSFATPLVDLDNLPDGRTRGDLTTPGTYYWRLASIRPDGDHGPFGDPQRFELRALPEPPKGGLSGDGKTLVFKWGARAGDRQQVELARDPQFNDIVARDDIDGSEWQPPRPGGGRYYFRYRSVEPDGYVSPYSETLMVDVPRDLSFLLLLVPLMFAL